MQSPFIVELTEQNFREVLEGSMNTCRRTLKFETSLPFKAYFYVTP